LQAVERVVASPDGGKLDRFMVCAEAMRKCSSIRLGFYEIEGGHEDRRYFAIGSLELMHKNSRGEMVPYPMAVRTWRKPGGPEDDLARLIADAVWRSIEG
jgi:hypothetical protein